MAVAVVTPEQKRQLAAVRALLRSSEGDEVQQGLALLLSLQDATMLAVFMDGCLDAAGALRHTDEIKDTVQAAFRDAVALALLPACPEAQLVTKIGWDSDVHQFRGRDFHARVPWPVALRGLPRLAWLQLGAAAVTLGDLPSLTYLSLTSEHVTLPRLPLLEDVKLVDTQEVGGADLPVLREAYLARCSATVQRTIALQPMLRKAYLTDGILSAWQGSCVEELGGDWTSEGVVDLPALARVTGVGPIHGGAPKLRDYTVARDVDLVLEDLPSLVSVGPTQYASLTALTLRRLPALKRVDFATEQEKLGALTLEDVTVTPGDGSITAADLEAGTLELPRTCTHVILRRVRGLTSVVASASHVVLDDLPDLVTLRLTCTAPALAQVAAAPRLRELAYKGPIERLEPLRAVPALTTLSLTARAERSGRGTAPVDVAVLRALPDLASLTFGGPGLDDVDLAALAGHPTLAELRLGATAGVVHTALGLPALTRLATKANLTPADVRALLDHPTLATLEADIAGPPWMQAAPRRERPQLLRLRDALDAYLAGLARSPAPPARTDRAAMAEARKVLEANAPPALLPLLAGPGGLDLARALCEGTVIDADGQLVIGMVIEKATRVGTRTATALLVADAAGLLDGVKVLSLRGLPVSDLGVLRRHVKTLLYLDLSDCKGVAKATLHAGQALLAFLDSVEPLEGDPSTLPVERPRATEPQSSRKPRPAAAARALPDLLRSKVESDVDQGIALALASGRAAELLRGRTVSDRVYDGSNLAVTLEARVTLGLLAGLPPGDPLAAEVVEGVTQVHDLRVPSPAWVRHAANVTTVNLPMARAAEIAALLPHPERVTSLRITEVEGDLTLVQRFPALTELTLDGASLDVRPLAGHASLQVLTLAGPVIDPSPLAALPALRVLRLAKGIRLDLVVRALADRPVWTGSAPPASGVAVEVL